MTAPAAPRIPTPGDLARRQPPKLSTPARPAPVPKPSAAPAPVRAADAIAPGVLKNKEHFRKYFMYGMRASRMHAHARLVGHDLVWRTNHATGRISPNRQPSLEVLALATGLNTGQVGVALQILHTRGWFRYHVLQEGPRKGQTVIALTIPAAALENIRTLLSSNADEPTS
ncbi:hypothetical protein [Streptomyces hirsutus]|uniref:hypothetical protein n=1 Tax=Streptomyces hirsutus TaxID=35620 RepID=UPI003695D09F